MVRVEGHGDDCDAPVGSDSADPHDLDRAPVGRRCAPQLVGDNVEGPGVGHGLDGPRRDNGPVVG